VTRVVAALDASAAAGPVLATARALAKHLGAAVDAVHALEDGNEAPRAVATRAKLTLRTLRGPTVPTLVRVARAADVDMLVLGARGTEAGARPAGSVALAIVAALDKPVVVVPPHLAHPGRLERVLVPLDDTEATAGALRATIEFARSCELDVVVLHVHVVERLPLFEDQPQHERASWATEFLARNCPPGHELRFERRVGRPEEVLLRVAVETDVDLIALGWSQDFSAGRAAVVRATLARSSVPVLLVPVFQG